MLGKIIIAAIILYCVVVGIFALFAFMNTRDDAEFFEVMGQIAKWCAVIILGPAALGIITSLAN
ncbi:MAG: hypothetical protein KDK24_16910 [Pseudooceanicola sp.]|nr:hypothetical protein [Pseudooceanicola sp.]